MIHTDGKQTIANAPGRGDSRWEERVRELWRAGMPVMGSAYDNLEGHCLAESTAKLAAIKQYAAELAVRNRHCLHRDVVEKILAVRL